MEAATITDVKSLIAFTEQYLSVLECAAIDSDIKNTRVGADKSQYHEVSINHSFVCLREKLLEAKMPRKVKAIQSNPGSYFYESLLSDSFIIKSSPMELVYNKKDSGTKLIQLIYNGRIYSFHYGTMGRSFYIRFAKIDGPFGGKNWFEFDNNLIRNSRESFSSYESYLQAHPNYDYFKVLSLFVGNANLFKYGTTRYEFLPDLNSILPELNNLS